MWLSSFRNMDSCTCNPIPYDLAELVNNILPSDNRSGGPPLRLRETDSKMGKKLINAFSIQYCFGNRLVLMPDILKLAATLTLNGGFT